MISERAQLKFNHPLNTNLVQNSCSVPPVSALSDPTDPSAGMTPGLGAAHAGVPFICSQRGVQYR